MGLRLIIMSLRWPSFNSISTLARKSIRKMRAFLLSPVSRRAPSASCPVKNDRLKLRRIWYRCDSQRNGVPRGRLFSGFRETTGGGWRCRRDFAPALVDVQRAILRVPAGVMLLQGVEKLFELRLRQYQRHLGHIGIRVDGQGVQQRDGGVGVGVLVAARL